MNVEHLGSKKISGIDGEKVTGEVVRVPEFSLGTLSFKNQTMVVGEVAALQALGLGSDSAILGMDFLSQFSWVAIDFENQRVSFE